jgi:hypothetical protein
VQCGGAAADAARVARCVAALAFWCVLRPTITLLSKNTPRKPNPPPTGTPQKKSQENINSRLALVMKSGKYTLGYKTCLKTMRSGKGASVCVGVWALVLFCRAGAGSSVLCCRLISGHGREVAAQVAASVANVAAVCRVRPRLQTKHPSPLNTP